MEKSPYLCTRKRDKGDPDSSGVRFTPAQFSGAAPSRGKKEFFEMMTNETK